MPLPDCPRCGEPTLEKIRADYRGLVWAHCADLTCLVTVLLDAEGYVRHVGEPQHTPPADRSLPLGT